MLSGVVARTREAHGELDPPVDERLERICMIATVTVAEWMAGGRPEDGVEAANEAFELFGQLAAHRDAPLDEVTKRCLRWRDAVGDVLREAAAETAVSDRARRRALAMTQATLDVTLVRMCEVFEKERVHAEEELASRGEQLAFLATHDVLTGLPNRTLILDRAEQMLGRARRQKVAVAALHVNLDNFTAINDTLGHGPGDELLRAVAARLDGLVRDTDVLGRLGGDEFVVIAEEALGVGGPSADRRAPPGSSADAVRGRRDRAGRDGQHRLGERPAQAPRSCWRMPRSPRTGPSARARTAGSSSSRGCRTSSSAR